MINGSIITRFDLILFPIPLRITTSVSICFTPGNVTCTFFQVLLRSDKCITMELFLFHQEKEPPNDSGMSLSCNNFTENGYYERLCFLRVFCLFVCYSYLHLPLFKFNVFTDYWECIRKEGEEKLHHYIIFVTFISS